MNRLVKVVVFSAVVAVAGIFSAPKAANAGYGYGYSGYGYKSYSYNYAPTYYAPVYKYVPTYSYGYNYGGYCY